jgi:hypothetical protein
MNEQDHIDHDDNEVDGVPDLLPERYKPSGDKVVVTVVFDVDDDPADSTYFEELQVKQSVHQEHPVVLMCSVIIK